LQTFGTMPRRSGASKALAGRGVITSVPVMVTPPEDTLAHDDHDDWMGKALSGQHSGSAPSLAQLDRLPNPPAHANNRTTRHQVRFMKR
jgi:hypothetical protein